MDELLGNWDGDLKRFSYPDSTDSTVAENEGDWWNTLRSVANN